MYSLNVKMSTDNINVFQVVILTIVYCCRINLKMPPKVAAKIVGLRPALEALVTKATISPSSINEPDSLDAELMGLVRNLSNLQASRFGLAEEEDQEATEGWDDLSWSLKSHVLLKLSVLIMKLYK